MNSAPIDPCHMRHALALARRIQGESWPNPAVGCVIVKDGQLYGRGVTGKGGRPHAESQALRQAGACARDSDVYVTLEPCAHQGVTPSCADLLIKAGVGRCIFPMHDPDHRVNGKGEEKLAKAGIATICGLYAEQCQEFLAGYCKNRRRQLPYIAIKLATTLDGRIAAADASSKWITGPQARAFGHLLRAKHDAILVGRRTALQDCPELTCRLPGFSGRPTTRIIADSQLSIPCEHPLVQTAKTVPFWILTLAGHSSEKYKTYRQYGVELVKVKANRDGRVCLRAGLKALAQKGLTSLLVEGGAEIITGFIARQTGR